MLLGILQTGLQSTDHWTVMFSISLSFLYVVFYLILQFFYLTSKISFLLLSEILCIVQEFVQFNRLLFLFLKIFFQIRNYFILFFLLFTSNSHLLLNWFKFSFTWAETILKIFNLILVFLNRILKSYFHILQVQQFSFLLFCLLLEKCSLIFCFF